MEEAISVRGLRRSYGEIEALRGIDLSVARGEVLALLGPNGAGKTTTVEILEGHRTRSSGRVRVLGFDPQNAGRSFRARIGIVLQETGVEPYLTVAEIIDRLRGYYPDPLPLDEVLDLVGLRGERDRRVKRLSGGKKRRLDVAIGLAGNPELLFLDEPTTGFDPEARRGAWEMIRNLRSLGKTVVLTTHYMDEAQSLADRVAIIVGGEIVAEGPPGELSGRDAATRIRFRLPDSKAPPTDLGWTHAAGGFEIVTDDPTLVLHRLTDWALEEGIALQALTVSSSSLEDVYLELTRTEKPR